MDKVRALHTFWNGFGIPAYDESTVPSKEERIALHGTAFPYITYEMSTDSFGNTLVQTASLWYRDSSWAGITAKAEEISDFITRGGRMIVYDIGAMWIQKASPWAQRMSEPSDDMVRRIIMNITVEFLD